MAEHDFHATFAENIGADDCSLPARSFRRIPTRQPIVLDLWQAPEVMKILASPTLRTPISSSRSVAMSPRRAAAPRVGPALGRVDLIFAAALPALHRVLVALKL